MAISNSLNNLIANILVLPLSKFSRELKILEVKVLWNKFKTGDV